MLKRGVFAILFFILVSSVIALTGDFDNNGVVEFSDFVLFAKGFNDFNLNGKYDVRFDLNNDTNITVEDFFIFSDNYGKTNETNISLRPAAKPLAYVPLGSPGIPGLAALYGDLNADDCVKQDDLDKWKTGRGRGAFDASVLRTVHDLDFNADTKIDEKDEKIIQDNIGKCFEKDLCTKQYSNEEERNKCLILSASDPDVTNEFCLDSESTTGLSDLCSEERMNLCNLIRDPLNLQNEINLKEICHNRYKLYLQALKLQSLQALKLQLSIGIGF